MKRAGSLALAALFVLTLLFGLAACGKTEAVGTTAVPETLSQTTTAATEAPFDPPVSYRGHEIIDGTYTLGRTTYPFRYSDGLFEDDPRVYGTHLATASTSITHAATKGSDRNNDFTNTSDQVASILTQIGFGSIWISPSYTVVPTTDSVACVFAEKAIENSRGIKRVISVTFRSGGYDAEWASNFLLGYEGEAQGVAACADRALNEYLSSFLSDKPDLSSAIERGEVAFWVAGYSRGGGIANLFAKRLIDRYHDTSNEIFAYCIEAQRAGVREEEDPAIDYSSIHNVVNPNDPVVYLSPAPMGFVRYGVDHYLYSDPADSENPIRDERGRATSDNKRYEIITEKRASLVKKHLLALLGDEEAAERYMPRTVLYKGLNVFTNEISDQKRLTRTASFIEAMLDGLSETKDGDPVTDRNAYVDCGMETAFGRMMRFLNTGFDIRYVPLDLDSLKQAFADAAAECKDALTANVVWAYGKATVNLHTDAARILTDALTPRLNENASLRELFAAYPDGGAETALADLSLLLYRILYATVNLDDLVTLAFNFEALAMNHENVHNLALLRTYDSWFDSNGTD